MAAVLALGLVLAGCDSSALNPPPEIDSVEPTSGQPGTAVTIDGAHFGSNASAVTVSFGGVSAPIQGVASNQIDTEVPEEATDGEIEVTVEEKKTVGPVFDVIPKGRIAFIRSNSDSGSEIYTMKPDGSDLKQITNDGEVKSDPDWSPDGSRIVFHSWAGGNAIYTMDPDGSNMKSVVEEIVAAPSWGPVGERIAYGRFDESDDTDIYTIDPEGSLPRSVTVSDSADVQPDWSPDAQIVFASNRNGNFEIYTMETNEASPTQITDDAATDRSPAWSPDGSRIAFVRSNSDSDHEIYTIKPDGSDLKQVTNHSAANYDPAWSPDGSRILFVSNREEGISMFTIAPDGSNLKEIPNSSGGDPAWGPLPQ